MREKHAKDKEELEKQLAPQKEKNKLKAKALEEIEKGNYKEAEGYLRKSAQESIVETATTFHELAELKKLQLHYQDAFDYCELAVRIEPENSLYLDSAGMIATDLGYYNEAIEYHERALQVGRNRYGEEHADIALRYNNLGIVYSQLGKYGEAIAYFEKALSIYKSLHGEVHV